MQMEDDEIEAEAAEEQEDSSGPRKLFWNHCNQYDSKRLGSKRWSDAILANSCEIPSFWIKFFDDFIMAHVKSAIWVDYLGKLIQLCVWPC